MNPTASLQSTELYSHRAAATQNAGWAPCHRVHVCTHTPVLKSLFFQSSNGLTSTPAALPEDRQALELHLFLTHGCTF